MPNEETKFAWGRIKAAANENIFGDHFPEGLKFSFRVAELNSVVNKETGQERITLVADCIGVPKPRSAEEDFSDYVGFTLRSSFSLPTAEQLEAALKDDASKQAKNKLFGARLFKTFMQACGNTEVSDEVENDEELTTPFKPYIGRTFAATLKDNVIPGKVWEKMDVKGNITKGKYPDTLTSQISMCFPVASAPTQPAEPSKPKTVTTPDVAQRVESKFFSHND